MDEERYQMHSKVTSIQRSSNKSKWISRALDRLFDIEYGKNKAIWKFVDALRAFLIN